jgi:hypothetical protein
MLTLQECVDFCELTKEEVQEIAEHEHLPEIVAAELGHSLLKSPRGIYIIRKYLLENLERAASNGNSKKARHLDEVITRFNAAHPIPRTL